MGNLGTFYDVCNWSVIKREHEKCPQEYPRRSVKLRTSQRGIQLHPRNSYGKVVRSCRIKVRQKFILLWTYKRT